MTGIPTTTEIMNNSKIEEHICDRILASAKYSDEYLKIRDFNGTWVFHKFHYACEKCVYDGEAQYEGELMTIFDVVINYCPYCGLLLRDGYTAFGSSDIDQSDKSEHKCSEIIKTNTKYPHVGFSFHTDALWKICFDEECWMIERHSEATENMIANGEAEGGEILFWHGTSISYCPFCGQKLEP